MALPSHSTLLRPIAQRRVPTTHLYISYCSNSLCPIKSFRLPGRLVRRDSMFPWRHPSSLSHSIQGLCILYTSSFSIFSTRSTLLPFLSCPLRKLRCLCFMLQSWCSSCFLAIYKHFIFKPCLLLDRSFRFPVKQWTWNSWCDDDLKRAVALPLVLLFALFATAATVTTTTTTIITTATSTTKINITYDSKQRF